MKTMKCVIYFFLLIVCHADKSLKVDIYPGFGWDHLRFIDMNPIFDVSNFNDSSVFQSCIEMIPLHENRIETGSTVIDAFDTRGTDHTNAISIGGGGAFKGVKISGSYSYEYQQLKQQQGEEKTITLRNHIDYLMVDVILQQRCPLNPQVKNDLIEIAKYITLDQPLRATYAAQLFVKRYGTHFTSRLQLGGSISEDDYVSHTKFSTSENDRRLHKAAAEASFLDTYSLKTSFSTGQNNSEASQQKQEIKRKIIHSKGGDVFIAGKHLEDWQESVNTRPAIIRRAIENMTYFIQSDTIPELTDVALEHVRQKINDAINTYIEMNVVRGCMHRNSPSFNWVANVDDGSCAPADQISQFGGFVRSCAEDVELKSKCHNYRIDNFYTGNEQCKPGFSKYLLHKSVQMEEIYQESCYDCGFLWLSTCCDNNVVGIGQRELYLYSCYRNITSNNAILGEEDTELMHVFGGSFTSKKVNPITDSFSCPDSFTEVDAFDDVKVCLAEKIPAHLKTIPHYGGMFSCDNGNIATESGAKACPKGYSVYVMSAIDGDCLINVCLKFETFEEKRIFPMIALPPFFDIELINRINVMNETLTSGEIASRMKHQPKSSNQSTSSKKSQRVTIGLSVGAAVIGIVTVAGVGLTQLKKYRKRRQASYSTDSSNANLSVIGI